MRAIALLWVISCHTGWFAWGSLPPFRYRNLLHAPWMLPFWRGDFAVEVFFVMSAFLIAGIITDERTRTGTFRVGTFYARRLIRLWPTLALAALFDAEVGLSNVDVSFLPNLLYFNNLLPVATVRMGWTWSLAIEEQFYLVVPWLLSALRAIDTRVRVWRERFDPVIAGLIVVLLLQITIAACVVVAFDLHAHDTEIAADRSVASGRLGYDLLYSKPWMRFGPLLVGVGCSHLYRKPGLMARLGASGAGGGIVLVIATVLAMLSTHWPLFADAPRWAEVLYMASFRAVFGLAVGYGMLFVLTKHRLGAAIGRFLGLPLFFPLAQLAYCAYLVNPVIALRSHLWLAPDVRWLPLPRAYLTLAGFDLLGTFSAALVLSLLIERPSMELRKVLVPSR